LNPFWKIAKISTRLSVFQLLAYRNIKSNIGSKTAGTDKLTISDIGKLSAEEVVQKVKFIV